MHGQMSTKYRHPCPPPAGFEPAIPTSERPQTHASHRAATRNERHMYAAYYTGTLIDILMTSYPMTFTACTGHVAGVQLKSGPLNKP
jgi:hypothetical protein